ncbi:hypothetical protein [Streptomyces sp. NPDC001307]|uniref:hypothetical protein n=1 Tax=Streptomyces sp. NPDC001307 TaxID=3364560 RepID=UPI00369124A9
MQDGDVVEFRFNVYATHYRDSGELAKRQVRRGRPGFESAPFACPWPDFSWKAAMALQGIALRET